MKTYLSSRRGIAAEVVILAVALIGGAGWFGVKEIKRAVVEYKQDAAAKELTIRQAAADAAAAAAADEREKAALERAAAATARDKERAEQIRTGRTIQRASVQGALITSNLPLSLERTLLTDRFLEIDVASAQLFNLPADAELAAWRKLAADALAGQAEAQARLAGQIEEVRRLTTDLRVAQEARRTAEQIAAEADAKAAAAQAKFDQAFINAKVAVNNMLEAVNKGDAMGSLLLGLKLLVCVVAGIWVLGLVLKIFSIGLPPDGPAARALDTAANTFNSFLAPMAVLGETHAKRTTEKLVDSAGNFISDVRDKLPPDMQEKVTTIMDVSLSPTFQEKVCKSFLKVRQKRAAEKVVANCG